jgi:hypothetical protein
MRKLPGSLRRGRFDSKCGLLLIGVGPPVVGGVVRLTDHGPSVDEWQNAYYGRLFLESYRPDNLRHQGSFRTARGQVTSR